VGFIDARELPDGHTVETDVCIVGAGAAGLALASALSSGTGGARVLLVESGGFEHDDHTQYLHQGQVVGREYPLGISRLRYFGGTTNHWGGNVRPLDAIDMEPRPWVPHSGWPITRAELDPYYERALAFLGLPDDAFELEAWTDGKACRPWELEAELAETEIFPAVAPELRQLGAVRRASIEESANVDVLLHANVLEFETDDPPRAVRAVRVATLQDERFRVQARLFVLATGGIENARLLLLSSSVASAGLGNDHDLVGRYFADHLVIPPVGDLWLSDPELPLDLYLERARANATGRAMGRAIFRLPDGVQREQRLQNCGVQLGPTMPLDVAIRRGKAFRSLDYAWRAVQEGDLPDDFHYHVANVIADVDELVAGGYRLASYRAAYPTWHVDLIAVAEPAPNPESRVRLGDERDPLGQRRIVLDWRLSPSDQDSVRRSTDLLAAAFALAGIGRVRVQMPEGGLDWFRPSPHMHHLGTTRMADDPKSGVVDRNCRVHGIENLWIAGSSVFPTYGHVNPTFTILALAFRLGDHLRGVLA